MVAWAPAEMLTGGSPETQDFARIWQAADKVVYSRTLESVSSARTRLVREFDADEVSRLKGAAERDLSVAVRARRRGDPGGAVDECDVYRAPIVVGGGTPALPAEVRWPLELLAQRRYSGGFVDEHYRTAGAG